MDDATVIDSAADVEGRILGQDARIHGRFKGEIELKGRLALGEGARVAAKVRCDAAEIAGEFEGELRARKLTLLEKARVSGTVVAEVLSVRDGAVVNAAVETATPGSARAAGPASVAAPAPVPAPAPNPAAAAASTPPTK